jgi:hypothetical protein
MALFQSLANCLTIQQGKEISLTKAFDYLKIRGVEIFLALPKGAHHLGLLLEKILAVWSQWSLKDRYHQKRPSTLNILTKIIPKSLT